MTWTRSVLLGLGVIVFTHGQADADCNNPFADPSKVLDFHFRISKVDWQAILEEDASKANPDGEVFAPPQCLYKYKQHRAEFRCGDSGPWLKISLRKKRGQERGNEAPQKPPLKVDFNQDFMGAVPEAQGQSWPASFGELGYRKLTLANGQGNKPPSRMDNLMLPILMTEHVTLRLLKREVPATPSSAYAKVYLHLDGDPQGQYRGLYMIAEDIDRAAIKRYFGNNDGRLIKSTKDNCNNEIEYDDGPPNEAAAAWNALLAKNPTDYPAPGQWLAEVEKGVDLDTLLRQEAIREILVNGDDTILTAANRQNEGLNYFTFDPKKGLRQFIPWDVDLTFGQQHGNCAPPPDGMASPGSARLMCSPEEPLFRWCPDTLSEIGKRTICVKPEEPQEVRQRYLQIMCQLTKGSLKADSVVKLWDEVYATISPIVPLEKDLVWQGMDPLGAVSKSLGSEYRRLRDWIPARIRSVQEQITKLGVPCAPGCEEGAKESCRYLGCPAERRCSGNQWTACQPVATCALPQPQTLAVPAAPAEESGLFSCRMAPGPRGTGPGLAALAPLLLVGALLSRRRRR
jgi:MYXO-CTERM domain-containing protein